MSAVRVLIGENVVIGGVLYPAGTILFLPIETIESSITGKAVSAAPMDKMINSGGGECVKRGPGRPPKSAGINN